MIAEERAKKTGARLRRIPALEHLPCPTQSHLCSQRAWFDPSGGKSDEMSSCTSSTAVQKWWCVARRAVHASPPIGLEPTTKSEKSNPARLDARAERSLAANQHTAPWILPIRDFMPPWPRRGLGLRGSPIRLSREPFPVHRRPARFYRDLVSRIDARRRSRIKGVRPTMFYSHFRGSPSRC